MRRRDFLAGTAASAALLVTGRTTEGIDGAAESIAGRLAERRQQATRDSRFESIASLVTRKMQEYRIPGVALGVRKDGRTIVRGFGVASVDDQRPVDADTIFSLASISKTVACTAIMRLAEQGRVELDAPVRTYIPEFRIQDEDASGAITVRHLLTHSPGFEGQLTAPDRGLASLEYFVQATVRNLPLLAPPGAVWSYNNAGYTVLGRMIEVLTGRDIHAALRELVFSPLELTRSFTRVGDVVTYHFAQGHRSAAGGAVEVTRPYSLSSSVTAGGVAMSITDIMSYAVFHLGEDSGARASLLSSASLDEMRRPQLEKAPTRDGVGLAWQLRPLGGVMTLMHGGTAGAGHRLLLELIPERRLAFSILTNHADGWRLVQDVERTLLSSYENLALEPNQPIVHRGINEAMTAHAGPLGTQPELRQYAGNYRRTPGGSTMVRIEGSSLVVGGGSGTRLLFYGTDVAYAAGGGGAYEGQPYEFIRQPDGQVGWIRVNGRIARRET